MFSSLLFWSFSARHLLSDERKNSLIWPLWPQRRFQSGSKFFNPWAGQSYVNKKKTQISSVFLFSLLFKDFFLSINRCFRLACHVFQDTATRFLTMQRPFFSRLKLGRCYLSSAFAEVLGLLDQMPFKTTSNLSLVSLEPSTFKSVGNCSNHCATDTTRITILMHSITVVDF